MSDLDARLRRALRSAGRRLTPQRRLILQVLEESNGHLDADALYDQVKARDPDVSLATVYRTLAVLRELGLVEEHRLGQDHGHFEAVRQEPHYHFTCLRCGKVIEFTDHMIEKRQHEIAEAHNIRLTNHSLYLYGHSVDGKCQHGDDEK